MRAKKQQLERYTEQWTDSKWGKEYIKAVYCHFVYLFFSSSRSLLIDSCIFSILFSWFLIIFTIIILSSFSGSLPISSSFTWACVFLVYSFICAVFLCLFIIFFKLIVFEVSFSQTSLVAQMVKHLSAMQETRLRSLGWEDPLEKEMATHSSILAWKIPWTEELGRLQSLGSQKVGHD